MLRKSNLWPLLFGSVGMLIVILDGKTAVSGVRDGVELCLNTLIPSLFPFFVLSSLVTAALAGHSLGALRSVCKFCRMSPGAESFLAVGILGGYPVGAATIAREVSKGTLSREEAQRMAVFCNNAGPSFLFGMLGPMFPDQKWVWLLWAIQICAAVLTGVMLPGGGSQRITPAAAQQVSLSDCLNRSIKSMALVCGWVILFRMMLEFLRRWILWLFPLPVQILLTGLLELSNGCMALSSVESSILRFLLAGFLLSMGGICVWMQTKAVFPQLRLSRFIVGRVLHCVICLLLSALMLPILTGTDLDSIFRVGILSGIAGIFLFLILRKRKKAVAFYDSMMYNSV